MPENQYREGQYVYAAAWGVALVRRSIPGGGYLLDWWGVAKDEHVPRLHVEIASEDAIAGPYYIPPELEQARALAMGTPQRPVQTAGTA